MTLAAQINAVVRHIRRDAEGHVIVLEQTFPTDPSDLWDACTNPARLARWFEPVTGDLELNGRYRLTGSGTQGTIERCEPPTYLVVSWEYEGDRSRVQVTIGPDPDGARLVVAHSVPADGDWERFGPFSGGVGWDESLLGLSWHLAGDARAEPGAIEAFGRSEDGQAFMADSIAAWHQAFVAAGAAEDVSQAAAQRAAEAYSQL